MEGPYLEVRKYADQFLDTINETAERKLVSGCGKILEHIENDFNKVCPKNDNNSSLTLQRREVLGRKVAESQEKMNDELKQLSECTIAFQWD